MLSFVFCQQEEIQRQQKTIEDLEEVITKTRRVCTVLDEEKQLCPL